jgi:class 3 adenylate cyclase
MNGAAGAEARAPASPQAQVTAPHHIASTESAGRALQIVDELLRDAAKRGELVMSWARVILCVLGLAVWAPFHVETIAAGTEGDRAPVYAAVLGVVLSAAILWRLRRAPATRRLLLASITLDAFVLHWMLLMFVLQPGLGYEGLPRITSTYIVLIGVFGAGMRLSRRGAIWGLVLHAGLLAGNATVEAVMGNPMHPHWVTDYTVVFTMIFTAGFIGYWSAARTRRLVMAGATEALAAAKSRALLGAYVSEEVAKVSLESQDLRLGGNRQDVAVLFSDLRGFTRYSEDLPPEELVMQLNRYLKEMVRVIQAEGGVVDKYIGDAIMAVFGAPECRDDDALRAIRAAKGMKAALVTHNHERERRGQEPLAQGIGVHFGPVVAGNIGTPERAAYTVIGDTVNLASRLESATKEQGVDVLISEDALAACGAASVGSAPATREVCTLQVRGRQQPVRVFTFGEAEPAEGA